MPDAKKVITKSLVFPKGGHFKLQKYTADGKLDPNKIYTSVQSVLKTVKRSTTTTTSPLADGNSIYAAHEFVTGGETTVEFGMSSYDPELEAFLCDMEYKEEAGTIALFESHTVPDATPYTIDLTREAADLTSIVVKDKKGNILTSAETAAANTFSAATTSGKTTLTFAAADTGLEIYVTYDAKSDTVGSMAQDEIMKLPAMQVTIMGEAVSDDETTTYKTNTIIDKATLSSGITPPDQSNDPTQGWSFTLKTGKPRAGKKAVTTKYAI